MDYKNYTDKLIDNFFVNNKLDDPNFFEKLENKIKNSQGKLNSDLNKLTYDFRENFEKDDKQRDEYKYKLQEITLIYNNFEGKVENLNSHYHNKLAYINTLSNYLADFEKFKNNINFANKIFEKLEELNSSSEMHISNFEIFTDPNKLIEEGIEIFHALRQIVDSCAMDFPNFVKNFNTMKSKIIESISFSIKDFYDNNELHKLESLFKVTNLIDSEMIIEMYVNLIKEQMGLNFFIQRLKNMSLENISNDMFNLILKIIEEFHAMIINTSQEQFGDKKSKIFLIFPEGKQKEVVFFMVKEFQQIIRDFREIFNSYDRNPEINETVINLIEYVYPESQNFVENFKKTLEYIESDIWNEIKNDTNMFLQIMHSVFQSRQVNKNLFYFIFIIVSIKQNIYLQQKYYKIKLHPRSN